MTHHILWKVSALPLLAWAIAVPAVAQKKVVSAPPSAAVPESPSCATTLPRQGWVNPEYRAQLKAQFDASEAARTDKTSPNSLLYGQIYRKAAHAGISEASYAMAQLYLQNSRAGDINAYSHYVEYRLRAAQQGHAQAQFELGEACLAGSPDAGRVWITRSADQGYTHATSWLAANR